MLRPLAESSLLRQMIVATVLFLMSFPLGFGAMWKALRRPGPALLASAINYGVLPLIAWAVYLGVGGFLPRDLAIGICVAGATPSTLASGAVWTRRAGGNDAVAILVTIITNVSCFVITPLWLLAMTHHEVKSLEFGSIVVKLLLLVVVPMAAAQVLRIYRPLADWATRQKTPMGVLAQLGVLGMILLGTVNTGLSVNGSSGGMGYVGPFAAMIIIVLALHLSTLWAGHVISRVLGIDRPERIAVGFSGSQKTLMVGLVVALEDYGDFPLAVFPIVAYHVCQLLVDTVIADHLRASERLDAAQPPEKPADAGG